MLGHRGGLAATPCARYTTHVGANTSREALCLKRHAIAKGSVRASVVLANTLRVVSWSRGTDRITVSARRDRVAQQIASRPWMLRVSK